MATIKTQGGKIITKNGKVSCTCCAEPGECCMYPAAALVASLYSYEDLPDAIDVGGIEYTKLDPPESVGGFTRYYINANDEYLGILEGEGEDSLWTYEGGGGPCLINAFNGEGGEREDQFADTYTVSGPPGGDVAVTRISLCEWEGLDSCGNKVTLTYNSGQFSTDALWVIGWLDYFGPVGDCIQLDASSGEKSGFQNTPVGSYTLGSVS